MENPILNLRWRQHGLELTTLLDDVRMKGLYTDAIISCEDQHYPVHSALLAISSDFFAQIFKEKCCDKNLIVIKDVLPFHLEKLLIYIYSGEVSIHQDEITKFLELGKSLQIKGTAFTYGDNRAISGSSIDNLHDERLANSSNYTPSHEEAARPQIPATPSLPMDLTLNMNLNMTPNMIPSASTSTPVPPLLSPGTTLSVLSSFPSSLSSSSASLSANSEVLGDLASAPSSTTTVNSVKSRVTASVNSNEPQKEVLSFEALVKEEPKNSEEISDSDDIDRQSAHAYTEAEVKTGEEKILISLPPMIPLNSRNEETLYRLEKFHSKTPTNSHLGLNSSSYLRSRDEDFSENDYLQKNYTISPTDKVCYRVNPLNEAETAKNSQCQYLNSHMLDDGSHYHQHQRMSSINRKDLDPKIQVNRTEHSTEMNPVIVKDKPLSHRNSHLLINPLPAGPNRYDSRNLGNNKNASTSLLSSLTHTDSINFNKNGVPESQKRSIPAESSGATEMSYIFKNTISSATSNIVVSKDLKSPNFNQNSHLDNSQNSSNVTLISPPGSVSLSPKEFLSKNSSGSDSDVFHEDRPSFSNVSSNSSFSSPSSYSSTQASSSYSVYDSLPSTSRDNNEKTEEYSHDQNTLGSNKSRNKNNKSEDDPCLKRVQSNAHGKRFRGPKAWEFLARLLKDPSTNGNIIRWEDEENMVFRLVNPNEIARRWGSRQVKNSKCRSYENFARSLRYHYSTGALASVSERQLVYKFGPKAIKVLEEYDELFPKTGNKPCTDPLDTESENFEFNSNSGRELSYKVGPKAIVDMVEYDSIFPKTGGKQTTSENIRPERTHIEKQHYDNNPQVNGKKGTVEFCSMVNPSLQLQTEISSNSTDLTPVINIKDGIVFQSDIGSHNYRITDQTPSGSVLPGSNIPALPVFRAAVPVPRTTAVPVPRSTASSQHESAYPMTITNKMNVSNNPGVNKTSRYTNLAQIRNISGVSMITSSIIEKNAFTSTPGMQSYTIPNFISKTKSVSNPTFVPPSKSQGHKRFNTGTLTTFKTTTTTSTDNAENECNDSSLNPYEKNNNKGEKRKLEENKRPLDFKKRWKNNYQS